MEFFDKAKEIMAELEKDEHEHIHEAAILVSESIRNGGIIQAFGSGHSYAGAIEVCGRAGGLIPSKVIRDRSDGMFEAVEGNAKDKQELYAKAVSMVDKAWSKGVLKKNTASRKKATLTKLLNK